MINRRYVRFPAGRGMSLCQWCVKIQRSAPVALLFQCWSRIMAPPHYWGFLWGLCWFSRNMNLLTRSGPEGSSHSRGIVCRDVAGKAPTHFCCTRLVIIPLLILFASVCTESFLRYSSGAYYSYIHNLTLSLFAQTVAFSGQHQI